MKKKRSVSLSIAVSLAIVGGLGFLPDATAHGTEIRVHANSLMEKASPELFGNSVIFDGGTMGFNEWVSNLREYNEAKETWNSYLSDLIEMGPTVLRYPGGLTANTFSWKAGIGPFLQRNPNYSGPESPHPEDVEAWGVAQWSAWQDEYDHYYESQVLLRQHLEEMTIAEYQQMAMIPLESMTPEDRMMFRTLEQACLHYGLFD